MITIKEIKEKDIDLCYELDLNTLSLWSKKQWTTEFKKEGVNVFGLILSKILIGVCVSQVILDEAHINYFVIKKQFREKGFGSHLMSYLIRRFKNLNLNKILLEVSQRNVAAGKFYDSFDFSNVGIRKNYYKDGSDALLKEKKLTTK